MISFLHTFDPFALKVTDTFGIRWYGLAYVAGFLAGYWLMLALARSGRTPLKSASVGDFVFAVAVGTIVGGRLGYCVFYEPSLLTKISGHFPFWGVLELHRGGMASHGGMIGITLACWLFAKREKISMLNLMDLNALAAPIGIFFGRLANFVNGELVGRPSSATLPWGVKFPQDIFLWPHAEPARLLDLAPLAQRFGIALDEWKLLAAGTPSSAKIEGVLWRIVESAQAGDPAVVSLLNQILTTRHPSQIYEALLEGLLLFIVGMLLLKKLARPGVVCGWFLVLYSVVRFIGEQFRMPDAHLGYQLFNLTRGQWLSIGMFFMSLVFLCACEIRARRSSTRPPT